MLKKKLIDFSHNAFSQFGEDGIIRKIFDIIGIEYNRCCEFGAVDGFTLANTAYLFTNGMEAILIEANIELYKKLKENTKQYNCKALNYHVGKNQGEDSLDYIFDMEKLNKNLDLLSIDVDGNDYYILESLKNFNARVIMCEYNPNIPYFMDLFGDYNNDFGSSVTALNRIVESKGYFLACITDANCIFIQKKYKWLFEEYEMDIDKIACNKYLKYVITNYKGDYTIVGDLNKCYGIKNILNEHINNKSGERINQGVSINFNG
ncbi:MAG: hypothetical protein PHP92_03520 [Candidatus Nanoarchaeia archaeon]|nr:hypothetical protein [Candidatus Nanoarchaeia archaeon]